MTIHIDYLDDAELQNFPWFWQIEENGANQGHGLSTSKKSAFKDACAYYCYNHKWED